MATSYKGKVEGIINFSAALQERLNRASDLQSDSFADLFLYLNAVPLQRSELSRTQRHALRNSAIELWNSCNRHEHYENGTQENGISAKIRTFSYFILASLTEHYSKFTQPNWRLFQIALNTAQCCLRACEVELAHRILANEAEIRDLRFEKLDKSLASSRQEREIATFDCLRIAVEWKRDRLDLAEHFFNRSWGQSRFSGGFSFEGIVDLAYEIGNGELLKGDCNAAATWLRRARCLLTADPTLKANLESSDLPMTISHTYVRALIGHKDTHSNVEARQIAKELRQEYGERLAIILLHLELHVQDANPACTSFYEDLSTAIRSVHLTEGNHKMISYYILKLRDLNIDNALKCLYFYILHRLGPHGNLEWLEKAILTYIWLSSVAVEKDPPSEISRLPIALDGFEKALGQKLSPDTAHTCHILLWKFLNTVDQQSQSIYVACCCQTALHPLLEQAGDDTMGRFERRLLQHYLATSDISAAQALLKQMPSSRKQHKLSRFLAFCIALRADSDEDICIALGSLNSLQGQDMQLLFAYAAESLKCGNSIQGARTLQRILDKDHHILGSKVNVFALLRSTISLLMDASSQEGTDLHQDDEILKRLCGAFKTAITFSAKKSVSGEAKLKSDECQSLRNSCYNIALQHLKVWPVKYVIDLLQYSSQLNDAIGVETALRDSRNKIAHDMNVAFIQAVLYIQKARQAPLELNLHDLPQTSFSNRSKPLESEKQLVLYHNAFARFTRIHQAVSSSDITSLENGWLKTEVTVPLAFEALLFINAQAINSDDQLPYDEMNLSSLISFAVTQEAPARILLLLAEALLSYCSTPDTQKQTTASPSDKKIPLSSAAKLLSSIIEVYRNQQDFDLSRTAQWLRCMIQSILDDLQHDIAHRLWHGQSQAKRKERLQVLHSAIEYSLSLSRTALKSYETSEEHPRGRNITLDDDMQLSDCTITSSSEKNLSRGSLYPAKELEWIAISVFNIGIDFYVGGEPHCATEFVRRGLEVADTLASYDIRKKTDRGGLGKTQHRILSDIMRDKISELGWSA